MPSTRGGPRGRAQVPHAAPRWVIERQQTLRRLGYGGVVDGRWGPRARKQWNEFLRDLTGRQTPRHTPTPPLGVRRNLTFLASQHRFQERLEEAKARLRSSHAPGGLPQQPIGFSPAGIREGVKERIKMERHQEKWRLARRNPVLMRAYFGGRGQLPTGEASVPWGQPFITKDLGAEDVLGLIDRDFARGTGIFLKPVVVTAKDGSRVAGVTVTPTAIAMLRSWLNQRGGHLPANPRSDQINRALADLARRKAHQEQVRVRRQVRAAYFDTGLWQRALVDLGIGHQPGTTMVGGELVSPKGVPDLWTVAGATEALVTGRMGLVPILERMDAYQERSIIDKNFQRLLTAYINMGPLLGLSSAGESGPLTRAEKLDPDNLGKGTFDIQNPFLPRSLTHSKDQEDFESRLFAEKTAAYDAIKAKMNAFAEELSTESGERYTFDIDLFVKTQEEGLAARFPGGDPGGLVHHERARVKPGGVVGFLREATRPLSEGVGSAIGLGSEAGAKALAVSGYPATVLHSVYVGFVGSWQGAMVDAGHGAGLQYVKATRRIDGTTGATVETIPGHFIGIEDAYARGVIWRDELPWYAQLVGDSVLDPLNVVSGAWIVKPVQALKRWRQGVEVLTDTAEYGDDVLRSADLIAGPTGTVRRQAGFVRAQLESKVEVLDEIGQQVQSAQRKGNFEELGLSRTLGQTEDLRRAKNAVGIELETAPFIAPLMPHIIRHGVSIYRDVERRDLSGTGYFLLGQMEQWLRGSTRRQVQRAFPELELPDHVMSGFGHGPVHHEVLPLYEELMKTKRDWVVNRLLPALQDVVLEKAPVQFDAGGRYLPAPEAVETERVLEAYVADLVADQIDAPNHIFGHVFTQSQRDAMVRAEAKEIASREIGRDRLDNWRMWQDPSDAAAAYRQNFVRHANELAEHAVSQSWLAPGERWSAGDILDEVQARKAQAEEEVELLEQAARTQRARQNAILDVAGEYLLLTFHLHPDEKGSDYLKGLWKWTNADLIERFLARFPNYPHLGDLHSKLDLEEVQRRRNELAIGFARQEAGLPEIDWQALAHGAETKHREARRFLEVNGETWDVDPSSVMMDVKMRRTVEHAVHVFFEGDLEAQGLGRGAKERNELEQSIDKVVSGAVSGKRRKDLMMALRDTVLDSAELVELRANLEDLQRQVVRDAKELEYLHSQEGIPHSELRQRGRELEELKGRAHKASNAFFAELWSTADHGVIRDLLNGVREERDAIRRMRQGDPRAPWQQAISDPAGRHIRHEDVVRAEQEVEEFQARQAAEGVESVEPRVGRAEIIDYLHQRQVDLEQADEATARAVEAEKARRAQETPDWLSDIPLETPITPTLVTETWRRRVGDLQQARLDRIEAARRPDGTVPRDALAKAELPTRRETRQLLEARVAPFAAAQAPRTAPWGKLVPGRLALEALDNALSERVRRLELFESMARTRRGLVTEMKAKSGQFAMRSAMVENFKELTKIERSQHRASQLAAGYDAVDMHKLYEAAGKGAGGWMDLRPTIRMPRSLATHQETRAQNLVDLADEAETMAWMMQDPDFLRFPAELAIDEQNLPIGEQFQKVLMSGDRVARAEIPTRMETNVDVEVPRVPVPESKRGLLVTRKPSAAEVEWALGGPDRPNRGRAPAVGVLGMNSAQRLRNLTPEKVASEAGAVRRLADALRERQGIYKAYGDLHRSKLLKERGLWIAAGKYSDSIAIRGIYHSYMAASQVWKTMILPGSPGWTVLNYIDGSVKSIVKGIADPRLWLNPNGKSFPALFPLSTIGRLVRVLDRVAGTNVSPKYERMVWGFYNQHRDVLDKIAGTHGISFPHELMQSYVANSMRVQGDRVKQITAGGWRQQWRAAQALRLQARDLRRQADAVREQDWSKAWDLMQRSKALRRRWVVASADAFHDYFWQIFVEIGEGRFRKAAYVKWYRDEMARQKALNPGWDQAEHQAMANEHAMENVDHTFFSASSATVGDDNLAVLWPFIRFVKDNTKFWAKEVYRKPGLLSFVDHVQEQGPYSEETGDPNAPSWLERYWTTTFLGQLPIFSQMNSTLFKDGKFDPLNLTSLGLVWRSFKAQNELLTDEEGGIAFLNLFAGATSDIGLGMSPWTRKPLEATGLISPEFWRDVFPQTSVIQAFDAKFFADRWPDGINLELLVLDPIYQSLLDVDLSQLRRRDYDTLVNRELAGAKLRGEEGTVAELRERAEKKVSDAIIVRNFWNWATHVYIRRVTPSDIWFYRQSEKMARSMAESGEFDDTYRDFSDKQQLAYDIYKRRKQPVGALDKWVADQGLVQHYYNLLEQDPRTAEAFFLLHPELVAYVGWRAREFNLNGEPKGAAERYRHRQQRRKRNATLAARTDVVMNLADAMRTEQHDGAYRTIEDQWRDTIVTQELVDFWARNDTPADDRKKMVRLEYDELVDELHRDYFSIPEGDIAARSAFLKANPLLVDVWRRGGVRMENGLPAPGAQADDLRSLVSLFRAHARDYYFALMDSKGGYDAAAAFLKNHSDIFVGTKSALHISDPWSDHAIWLPSKRGDELSTLYLKAKPWLDLYFAQGDAAKARGGEEAGRLARRAVGDVHPIVYEYFDLRRKWEEEGKVKPSKSHDGKIEPLSQHAKDYRAVKDQLDAYFALPAKSAARRAYAAAHPEIVAYFRKYSKGGGGRGGFYSHRRRRYAQGWVASQAQLDAYFDLEPGEAREAYLAKHPELAGAVVEGSAARTLGANKLHVAARYRFWMHFFALAPDEREAYVRAHAADAGIFVYGILGARELWDNQQSGLAWKFAHGELSRQQAYLMIKPLMDLFFSLPPEQRAFYEQMNPEITIYMRLYAHHTSLSGNAATDKLLAGFFDLPDWDTAKKQEYLEEHPEVQKWLHSRGSPEERALSRLISAYFKVPMEHRQEWLMMHPEVLSYFDVRSAQRDQEDALGEVFDELDPRLDPYEAMGYEDKLYAETIGLKLRLAKEKPVRVHVRREREFSERERADTT